MGPGAFGYALPAGRILGIPLTLHWSLLALVVVHVLHALVVASPSFAGLALILGVLAIGSVLAHELAHALAARSFGYVTRSIELHAFGGVAQISGGGHGSPAQLARADIVIALAGPTSNFLLYGLCTALASVLGGSTSGVLASDAARLNLVLGLFNLVPCFPLDGGRALLSALRLKIGAVKGDRLTYTIGLWIAAPGFIYGMLISSPVIALLFYIAFDVCRQARARIDASFGGARVVHPFTRGDASDSPGWLDWIRGLVSRSREPRPPKLRVIKGGRFEDPPDRKSGRV